MRTTLVSLHDWQGNTEHVLIVVNYMKRMTKQITGILSEATFADAPYAENASMPVGPKLATVKNSLLIAPYVCKRWPGR